LIIARGRPGLPAQRNAILDAARDIDILVFFDDDFFAASGYLAELESCFQDDAAIIAMSGKLIADGVTGPGMDADRARRILASFEMPPQTDSITDIYNAYGCNMALRLAPIRVQGLRFDESLPLYGWLEDVDFSRQLAAYGRIVKNQRMAGVHLGVKG